MRSGFLLCPASESTRSMLSIGTTEAIVELVQERWDHRSQALLLSQIPGLLRSKEVDIRSELGHVGLKDAIELLNDARIRLVSSPSDSKILGLVPADVVDDVESFFAPTKKADVGVCRSVGGDPISGKSARFNPGVWAAFAKPLEAGVRYLILSDPIRFVDSENALEMTPNTIEVPTKQIRRQDEVLSDDEIGSRIAAWAWRNGIRQDILLVANGARNIKFGELSRLPPEDLQRIMIPLDVVLKLIDE